jgi:peptidoglycan biosynthesis protein MviN/MurJ (putative lipid II flippase)
MSGSTSEISGPKTFNEPPLVGRGSDENPEPRASERYTTKDLLIRLAIIFFPMIIVSTFLLVLLVIPQGWRVFFEDIGTTELPVNFTMVSNNSYYTSISQGRVSIVSGWASHAAFFVTPYFMILFSYCVAHEVALERPAAETINNTREIYDLLHGLLTGAWKDTLTWVKFTWHSKRLETLDGVLA